MNEQGGMDGEDYIGTFNNEDRPEIDRIKRKAANLINMINSHGNDKRRNAVACTHIEVATMMAVKSIFTEVG